MSLADDNCCPGETTGSGPLGGVKDPEILVVAVRHPTHYRKDAEGRVVLTHTAISADDLKGKIDQRGRRGVSFEREVHCPNLLSRMQALTKDEDPVVAKVKAETLRKVVDTKKAREICVHAEPTGDEDAYGPSNSHGAFRAKSPRAEPPTALTWMELRKEVASRFQEIVRIVSNQAPAC